MTATASHPMNSSGLKCPLQESDLSNSNSLYNSLSHIDDQPHQLSKEDGEHVKALLNIIKKYKFGSFCGIHSVHRHDPLPKDTVRLEGEILGIESASWTRAVDIDKVDLNNVHGTTFKLVWNTLVPFEFAQGTSPLDAVDATKISTFLTELSAYLTKNNLTNRLALEVKDFAKYKPTSEIEIQWGNESFTVTLPRSTRDRGIRPIGPLQPTGWSTGPNDPDPEPSTHYEPVVVGPKKDSHKVIVNKSTFPCVTPSLLVRELGNLGFVPTATAA